MKKSIIFAMVAIVAIACSLTSCVKNVEVSDEQNSVAYEESVLDEQEPVS